MVIKKRITPCLVSEHESIRTALAKIDSNTSGIVFCTDESGLLLGVLTDGDLRRWLMTEPVPNLELSVAEIINRKFVSAQIAETAERIASLLDRGIRVLPLVDRQGRCIGLAERHKTEMEIGTRRIGMGYPAFIIAEIGNNHNGSMEAAKKLVDEAIGAGADCAKF